jgi:hypothetical protein
MPSLYDLFSTQKLKDSGKTAKEEYEIRNSKSIPITTSNGILNGTVFPIVQKTLRSSKVLTNRLRETLIEEESVGIRPISKLAAPVTYGSSIIKFETQKSEQTVAMKQYAKFSGTIDDNGIIGNLINKVKEKVTPILNKVGVTFPTDLIPSRVANEYTLLGMGAKGNEPDTMITLSKIKGEGSILGKFIQQNAKGTPKQIGRQLIGGIQRGVKDKIRNKLFGQSAALLGNSSLGRSELYKLQNKANETIYLRNDIVEYGSGDENGKYKKYTYQLKKYRNAIDISESTDLARLLYDIQNKKENEFINYRNNSYDILNFADPKTRYNSDDTIAPLPTFSLEMLTQNIPGRNTKGRYSKSDIVRNYKIDKNGVSKFNSIKDDVNNFKHYYSETGEPSAFEDKTIHDDYDFIPLRFYSVSKKTGVSFKATISGLSETVSPQWDSAKFVGNPYNFYTYGGVERSVSFNFKVFSLSGDEHISAWQRLNFLAGLTYPQNTSVDNIYTTPPIIKFTLGNMYKNKVAIIDSLSFSVDDNTPWEIGLTPIEVLSGRQGNLAVTSLSKSTNLKNYKLPTIIDVQIGIKFIETASQIAGKKLYYYGDNEKDRGIQPDGRVLPPKASINNPTINNQLNQSTNNIQKAVTEFGTFNNNLFKTNFSDFISKSSITNKLGGNSIFSRLNNK